MPMKSIEIHRYIGICPACGWKSSGVEDSVVLAELVDHVERIHEMGEPRVFVKKIPVGGGFQDCDVAIFGNHSYWTWIDRFPKSAT